ncbi:M48 family metallopeptidase [Paenalcaligenes hominis]|uniref:M48 family metallopeptidase n=1 Tax=Paenalcaligenes hominis TaxID=643674 RepID=UPI003526330B
MTLLVLFVIFLVADFSVRNYLALRQIRHVRAYQDQVPAEFSHHISLRSHQRAAKYTSARAQLSLLESTVDTALLVGLLLLGGLQWLDTFWARTLDNDWLRQLALIGSVFFLGGLVQLPFTVWRTFVLEQRFGFNRMPPRLFVSDLIKTLLLSVLLGVPLISAVLWLMASAGSSWPWWAWLIWVSFSLCVMWLFPSVIAPLFNQFKPLERADLKHRIEQLAQRCGFTLSGLFVMDGSKRSAHGNAYFTGIGNNKRIVFFDTLLNKLNEDEIEAVLAHELGHFKFHHIRKRMVLSFGLSLVLLLCLGWLSQHVWFYTELGVLPQLSRPNDGLALILFFLTVPIFTFWAGPLFSFLSRKDEYQADAFAAQQSRPEFLVQALIKLYDDNAATLTPDPLYSAYYASHPAAVQRVHYLKQFYEKN